MTGYLPSASLPPAETGGHKLLHTALAACLLRLMYGAMAIKSLPATGHSRSRERSIRRLSLGQWRAWNPISAFFFIILMGDDAGRRAYLTYWSLILALLGFPRSLARRCAWALTRKKRLPPGINGKIFLGPLFACGICESERALLSQMRFFICCFIVDGKEQMFGYGAAARAAPNFHPPGFCAHALRPGFLC